MPWSQTTGKRCTSLLAVAADVFQYIELFRQILLLVFILWKTGNCSIFSLNIKRETSQQELEK